MGHIAEDKKILSCQFSDKEHAILKQIAIREGVSLSELVRAAVHKKYIDPDVPEDLDMELIKTALAAAYNTAVEYVEKKLKGEKPLYQLVAEAQEKYGGEFEISVELPDAEKAKTRKKRA